MDLLKIALIISAVFFLYLLLKSGLWRRIPVVSAVISIALFVGIIIIGFIVGSVLIFALLGIILFAIIIFTILWIFGRARFYRISGKESIVKSKNPKKKPKVKIIN
ncbi:MAG: hypothetical protein KJ955_07845 [Nanoarchaeota archaeon]|nr:hypothetical protein [Nanoarchaeota archaeon]